MKSSEEDEGKMEYAVQDIALADKGKLRIDALTDEQKTYLASWEQGT